MCCLWHARILLKPQKPCFNPFLFRGVLSVEAYNIEQCELPEFQSLLIQGCVVCEKWICLQNKGESFQSLLIQGCVVCMGYPYGGLSSPMFQSLLIQGCVVWKLFMFGDAGVGKVSIPSYSGVCCLAKTSTPLLVSLRPFQSLLIQGCVVCLPWTTQQLLLKTFQSLLIQGCVVWRINGQIVYRSEYVSIPSYSGVCCLWIDIPQPIPFS